MSEQVGWIFTSFTNTIVKVGAKKKHTSTYHGVSLLAEPRSELCSNSITIITNLLFCDCWD